jgi:hypothetical protein
VEERERERGREERKKTILRYKWPTRSNALYHLTRLGALEQSSTQYMNLDLRSLQLDLNVHESLEGCEIGEPDEEEILVVEREREKLI